VLGDRDKQALSSAISNGFFPKLFEQAKLNDVLPALTVRCNKQLPANDALETTQRERLNRALHDNTLQNMKIKAQALKLTKALNTAGITPLFLKGTIDLLDTKNENIGFRKQVDIDLLVPPEELEAAGDTFLRDGYGYHDFEGDQSTEPPTTRAAIKISAAHHHLPPLVKKGYDTTVELHSHFLAKQQQRNNPLEPLFRTAQVRETHDAAYLIPTTEYQLIHLVEGKFVHDGHLARRTFPLREACDFISLMDRVDSSTNLELVIQHCGNNFAVVHALVRELMGYTAPLAPTADVSSFITLMQRRYNSPTVSRVLNSYARTRHLAGSLAHSPGKLSAYLGRLFKAR